MINALCRLIKTHAEIRTNELSIEGLIAVYLTVYLFNKKLFDIIFLGNKIYFVLSILWMYGCALAAIPIVSHFLVILVI